MYAKWLALAWANRDRILAVARKLHWPLRTWLGVGLGAAIVGALGWMATHGRIVGPSHWPPVQWALIVVNVVGFAWLYLVLRGWYSNQDEVWDEVDRLRGEVAALAQHEHGPSDVLPTPEALPVEGTEQRELGGRVFTFVKG